MVFLISNVGLVNSWAKRASSAEGSTWVSTEATLEDEMPSNMAEMTTKGDPSCLRRDRGQRIWTVSLMLLSKETTQPCPRTNLVCGTKAQVLRHRGGKSASQKVTCNRVRRVTRRLHHRMWQNSFSPREVKAGVVRSVGNLTSITRTPGKNIPFCSLSFLIDFYFVVFCTFSVGPFSRNSRRDGSGFNKFLGR